MPNQEIKGARASDYARSLIEASLDPLVTISSSGKITDVNEATIRATGATREELIGSDFSNYFTEPEKAKEGYQKVLKESKVTDYPLTIKHKNGQFVDVLYNASVYKDSEGNVLGVFAAARDITKTKQASDYARSLIEASLDPLVTISPNGKITDVNEATIKVTGATREELIGSIFSSYFTEPYKAEEGYQKVLKEGKVTDYPLTIRNKNGTETSVLYNAGVYKDAKGKVLGVFAAARDVTQQKQASDYARSLIEASLDPLVTISPNGKITDVNEATIKVTGVPRYQLIGSIFSNYFTEPEKATQGYEEVFEKGEVRDYLLTIRHKSGRETSVLYNASVYKDAKGKVLGAFAAAREIGKAELKAAKARDMMRTSKQLLFKTGISYKVGKGIVKIHDKDAEKVGLNIVDSVTLIPVRKEIQHRKLTLMSLTQKKYPEGMVILGIHDAKTMGLEGDDAVRIIEAEKGTDPSFVEGEQTEIPGEYESPVIEPIQKEKEEVTQKAVKPKISKEEPKEEVPKEPEQPTEEVKEEKPLETKEEKPGDLSKEPVTSPVLELKSGEEEFEENKEQVPIQSLKEKPEQNQKEEQIPRAEPQSKPVKKHAKKTRQPKQQKASTMKKQNNLAPDDKKPKKKGMKNFEDQIDKLRVV